jgi:hypothetical protein
MENKSFEKIVITILGALIGNSATSVFDNNTFTIINGITIGVCAVIIFFLIKKSAK